MAIIRGPTFWQTPIKYLKWSAHERPAYFVSLLLAIGGPVMAIGGAALDKRWKFLPTKREWIPMTYPVPTTPRNPPKGYED